MSHVFHELQFRLQYTGLSVRYLRKPLDYCQDLARQGASGGRYSTGRLAESIYKRGPRIEGLRIVGEVGSRLSYARYVERGTKIHHIFPKGMPHTFRFGDKRPRQLKFFWHGRVVYTPHVPMGPGTMFTSHPGMRGKHFLLRAITATSLRYRMKLDVAGLIRGL